jgi:hypothetical protein
MNTQFWTSSHCLACLLPHLTILPLAIWLHPACIIHMPPHSHLNTKVPWDNDCTKHKILLHGVLAWYLECCWKRIMVTHGLHHPVRPVVNPMTGTAHHSQTRYFLGRLCDFRAVYNGQSWLGLSRRLGYSQLRPWLRRSIYVRKARRAAPAKKKASSKKDSKSCLTQNIVTLRYTNGEEARKPACSSEKPKTLLL